MGWRRLERERVVVIVGGGEGSEDEGEGDGKVLDGRMGKRGGRGDGVGMRRERVEEGVRPWRLSQDGVRSLVDVGVAGVGYLL